MALEEKDIKALQLLIREGIRSEVSLFREDVASFRNDVDGDGAGTSAKGIA